MKFDYRRELKVMTKEQLKNRKENLENRLLDSIAINDSKNVQAYNRYLGYVEEELKKKKNKI